MRGKVMKKGNYPPGMVNFLVNNKLEFFAKGLRDFGEEKTEKTGFI